MALVAHRALLCACIALGLSTHKVAGADCASLQAQVDAAPAGATVMAEPCVYRETVTISKPLTLYGAAGTEIRGSDVWTDWTPTGPFWVEGPLPALESERDNGVCATGSSCLFPYQVFVDGEPLTHALDAPGRGQFAIDEQRNVVLADDPIGHEVEVTTRSAWLIVRADNVAIDGFTMQHAANAAQAGALVSDGGSNVIVSNTSLSYAHGVDIQFLNGTGQQLVDSDVRLAGQLGVSAYHTQAVSLRGNRIHDNNTAGFDAYWEAGAVKISSSIDAHLDGNDVYANAGQGLWCDLNCQGTTYTQNRVHDNTDIGIVFEISSGGSIVGNTLWNNGGSAPPGWGCDILVTGSSDADVAGNTVLGANGESSGIKVVSQDRPEAPNGGLVANVTVHDNALIASTP
jgi:parallel beta-helix repeat protein